LAEVLELPNSAETSVEQPVDLLKASIGRIKELQATLPASYTATNPLWQHKLSEADLVRLQLRGLLNLANQQSQMNFHKAKLSDINEVLKQEYQFRREMLIKRLDVTIQSLLWSDRLKVRLRE